MPTSRTAFRTTLTALSFALPLAFGTVASAQSACGDGPACPENWECRTEPAPCLALPCDRDGGECEPVDCDDSTYSYCAPLPCTSDSECGDGMVCYSETREECDSAPPCAGGDCPMTDSTCSPVTESGCVPRYVLPCEADADCGVGFTCEVEQNCQCTGSSGGGGSSGGSAGGSDAEPTPDEKAAPDGGGADPVPPDGSGATPDGGTPTPPDCTCTPTDRKSCNLKVVACSVDEGCLAGWTCGDNPNGSCWASSDGTSGCSADPAKICLPPYAGVIGGGGRDVSDGGEGTSTGGLSPDPDAPKGEDGSGAPAAGPSASDDSGSSDGCAIGHAPRAWHATFGFAALALAGLLGARRRRSR